jgi:hypothetical protein
MNEIKGITRHRLLLNNRFACNICHMRKNRIAPNGIQNYSNQNVLTPGDVNYGEKLKKLR